MGGLEKCKKRNVFLMYLSWFVLICIFLMVLEYWESVRAPQVVSPYIVFIIFLICIFRIQTLPDAKKIVIFIMLICIIPILRLSFIGNFKYYPKDFFYFYF